ncbi:MAG: glycosyl hydrolase 108 family protein [Pseudolabrys sp.]
MAASSYDDALRRLLAHEGGYTNHPADPGGPTNFGITIFDFRRYVKADATAADVKSMRLEDAKAIYRAKYWDAQRCNELPAGVDYAIFDYGVNSGIGRSGKVLRRVLTLADNTSAVSDAVIAAARKADAKALIAAICDERLRFLQSLKTWSVFGGGWGRRVAEVRMVALTMASGTPVPDLRPASASGRAVVPLARGAQQGSAGAIAAAGAAAAQQSAPVGRRAGCSCHHSWIDLMLGIAGWLAWQWRQRQRQEQPA